MGAITTKRVVIISAYVYYLVGFIIRVRIRIRNTAIRVIILKFDEMVQWSQNVGSIYCTSNTYIKVCRLDLDSLPEDDGADLEGVGAAVLAL